MATLSIKTRKQKEEADDEIRPPPQLEESTRREELLEVIGGSYFRLAAKSAFRPLPEPAPA